jgi:hypothetical protein
MRSDSDGISLLLPRFPLGFFGRRDGIEPRKPLTRSDLAVAANVDEA